jgi:Fervidolysin N-terminal prodomain
VKNKVFAVISVCLMVLFVAFLPQDKQKAKKLDQQKHMQMLEMMNDSAMVSMMMDSIASSSRMRMMMMQKMMRHAKADSVGMMQMSRMMADDQEMHATLTKLLDEQRQDSHSTAQEILIKFNPGVEAAQVSALESEVGLQQIKVIPELNVRVFKITSSKSVKEVIAICEKKPFIKYAEPNRQYKALKD